MGPQEDYIETVLTCEGDYYDPGFHSQLQDFSKKLENLLLKETEENKLILKKVEPWNSVKVTFNIPKEAANRLKQLAEQGDTALKELGIHAVQIEGDSIISLTFTGKNNEQTELVFRTDKQHRISTGARSIFDVNSADEINVPGPSNVEATRKNIVQYLSQSSGEGLFDSILNQNSNGTGERSPMLSLHSSDTTGLYRQNSQGALSYGSPSRSPIHASSSPGIQIPLLPGQNGSGYPSPSSQAQLQGLPPGSSHLQSPMSPNKFQNAPLPTQQPSSPGMRMAQNFPMHFQHPHQQSNMTMNSMQRMVGNKGVTSSSPLLVNLLQTDVAGAHFNNFTPQQMQQLQKMPPPYGVGPPAKRKRKPRKPKESKDAKMTRLDIEGGAVPNPILETNSPVVTPSGSPHPSRSPIRMSPEKLGSQQIINPYTGQLELVDNSSTDSCDENTIHRTELRRSMTPPDTGHQLQPPPNPLVALQNSLAATGGAVSFSSPNVHTATDSQYSKSGTSAKLLDNSKTNQSQTSVPPSSIEPNKNSFGQHMTNAPRTPPVSIDERLSLHESVKHLSRAETLSATVSSIPSVDMVSSTGPHLPSSLHVQNVTLPPSLKSASNTEQNLIPSSNLGGIISNHHRFPLPRPSASVLLQGQTVDMLSHRPQMSTSIQGPVSCSIGPGVTTQTDIHGQTGIAPSVSGSFVSVTTSQVPLGAQSEYALTTSVTPNVISDPSYSVRQSSIPGVNNVPSTSEQLSFPSENHIDNVQETKIAVSACSKNSSVSSQSVSVADHPDRSVSMESKRLPESTITVGSMSETPTSSHTKTADSTEDASRQEVADLTATSKSESSEPKENCSVDTSVENSDKKDLESEKINVVVPNTSVSVVLVNDNSSTEHSISEEQIKDPLKALQNSNPQVPLLVNTIGIRDSMCILQNDVHQVSSRESNGASTAEASPLSSETSSIGPSMRPGHSPLGNNPALIMNHDSELSSHSYDDHSPISLMNDTPRNTEPSKEHKEGKAPDHLNVNQKNILTVGYALSRGQNPDITIPGLPEKYLQSETKGLGEVPFLDKVKPLQDSDMTKGKLLGDKTLVLEDESNYVISTSVGIHKSITDLQDMESNEKGSKEIFHEKDTLPTTSVSGLLHPVNGDDNHSGNKEHDNIVNDHESNHTLSIEKMDHSDKDTNTHQNASLSEDIEMAESDKQNDTTASESHSIQSIVDSNAAKSTFNIENTPENLSPIVSEQKQENVQPVSHTVYSKPSMDGVIGGTNSPVDMNRSQQPPEIVAPIKPDVIMPIKELPASFQAISSLQPVVAKPGRTQVTWTSLGSTITPQPSIPPINMSQTNTGLSNTQKDNVRKETPLVVGTTTYSAFTPFVSAAEQSSATTGISVSEESKVAWAPVSQAVVKGPETSKPSGGKNVAKAAESSADTEINTSTSSVSTPSCVTATGSVNTSELSDLKTLEDTKSGAIPSSSPVVVTCSSSEIKSSDASPLVPTTSSQEIVTTVENQSKSSDILLKDNTQQVLDTEQSKPTNDNEETKEISKEVAQAQGNESTNDNTSKSDISMETEIKETVSEHIVTGANSGEETVHLDMPNVVEMEVDTTNIVSNVPVESNCEPKEDVKPNEISPAIVVSTGVPAIVTSSAIITANKGDSHKSESGSNPPNTKPSEVLSQPNMSETSPLITIPSLKYSSSMHTYALPPMHAQPTEPLISVSLPQMTPTLSQPSLEVKEATHFVENTTTQTVCPPSGSDSLQTTTQDANKTDVGKNKDTDVKPAVSETVSLEPAKESQGKTTSPRDEISVQNLKPVEIKSTLSQEDNIKVSENVKEDARVMVTEKDNTLSKMEETVTPQNISNVSTSVCETSVGSEKADIKTVATSSDIKVNMLISIKDVTVTSQNPSPSVSKPLTTTTKDSSCKGLSGHSVSDILQLVSSSSTPIPQQQTTTTTENLVLHDKTKLVTSTKQVVSESEESHESGEQDQPKQGASSKGISILKPLYDKESDFEDDLVPVAKAPEKEKKISNKTKKQLKECIAKNSMDGHTTTVKQSGKTIAQLLNEAKAAKEAAAAKNAELAAQQLNDMKDTSHLLGQSVEETVAQHINIVSVAQDVKTVNLSGTQTMNIPQNKTTKSAYTKPIQTITKPQGNVIDFHQRNANMHIANFIEKSKNTPALLNSTVTPPIMAPSLPLNLTESVQKVMKAIQSAEHPPVPKQSSRGKSKTPPVPSISPQSQTPPIPQTVNDIEMQMKEESETVITSTVTTSSYQGKGTDQLPISVAASVPSTGYSVTTKPVIPSTVAVSTIALGVPQQSFSAVQTSKESPGIAEVSTGVETLKSTATSLSSGGVSLLTSSGKVLSVVRADPSRGKQTVSPKKSLGTVPNRTVNMSTPMTASAPLSMIAMNPKSNAVLNTKFTVGRSPIKVLQQGTPPKHAHPNPLSVKKVSPVQTKGTAIMQSINPLNFSLSQPQTLGQIPSIQTSPNKMAMKQPVHISIPRGNSVLQGSSPTKSLQMIPNRTSPQSNKSALTVVFTKITPEDAALAKSEGVKSPAKIVAISKASLHSLQQQHASQTSSRVGSGVVNTPTSLHQPANLVAVDTRVSPFKIQTSMKSVAPPTEKPLTVPSTSVQTPSNSQQLPKKTDQLVQPPTKVMKSEKSSPKIDAKAPSKVEKIKVEKSPTSEKSVSKTDSRTQTKVEKVVHKVEKQSPKVDRPSQIIELQKPKLEKVESKVQKTSPKSEKPSQKTEKLSPNPEKSFSKVEKIPSKPQKFEKEKGTSEKQPSAKVEKPTPSKSAKASTPLSDTKEENKSKVIGGAQTSQPMPKVSSAVPVISEPTDKMLTIDTGLSVGVSSPKISPATTMTTRGSKRKLSESEQKQHENILTPELLSPRPAKISRQRSTDSKASVEDGIATRTPARITRRKSRESVDSTSSSSEKPKSVDEPVAPKPSAKGGRKSSVSSVASSIEDGHEESRQRRNTRSSERSESPTLRPTRASTRSSNRKKTPSDDTENATPVKSEVETNPPVLKSVKVTRGSKRKLTLGEESEETDEKKQKVDENVHHTNNIPCQEDTKSKSKPPTKGTKANQNTDEKVPHKNKKQTDQAINKTATGKVSRNAKGPIEATADDHTYSGQGKKGTKSKQGGNKVSASKDAVTEQLSQIKDDGHGKKTQKAGAEKRPKSPVEDASEKSSSRRSTRSSRPVKGETPDPVVQTNKRLRSARDHR